MKTSEKVYWIKAGGGVLTGVVSHYLLTQMGLQDYFVLMIGLSLFASISEGLSISTKIERDRSLKIGMGAFLFLWLISWTLLNSL